MSSDFSNVLQPAGITLVITGGVIAGIALIGYCGTSISVILKLVSYRETDENDGRMEGGKDEGMVRVRKE